MELDASTLEMALAWTHRWVARLACRRFRDLCRREPAPISSAVVSAGRLELALRLGCPRRRVCERAAVGGHLATLQWARANDCPLWMNEEICALVAKGGHLKTLQWMRANSCPWGWLTCSYAAGGGHLDVLKWARAHGCPWDQWTCAHAASAGHLTTLQWARANGCPWNKEQCRSYARSKPHILEWLEKN